ncbi:MAG: dTMP kinase [Alphaproteobacteria bacterium]|jgi:dTMP kinase|nr:dTMP kinase [Alphaproteobacteria bacterium]
MSLAGRFITLEGGEGTGKSTLQRALGERLQQRGHTVRLTREPGGTPLAEAVRELALHPPGGEHFSPIAEALLMNTARSDHLDKLIRPSLAAGEIVICDRFADSTRVYQSVRDGAPPSFLEFIESQVLGDTRPHLTLILDAAPGELLERRQGRANEEDIFEGRDLSFHAEVREGFLAIAREDPGRCHVIDATLGAGEVAEAALGELDRRLGGAAS